MEKKACEMDCKERDQKVFFAIVDSILTAYHDYDSLDTESRLSHLSDYAEAISKLMQAFDVFY